MSEMILETKTIQETLSRFIDTDKVIFQQIGGEIRILPLQESEENRLETIRQKRLAFMGCMDGQVWMSDDFDEPLEEMREYM